MTRIKVVCPVCNAEKQAHITLRSGKGIQSVLIPANETCKHVLLTFIKEDGSIHRIQRIDHLEFDAAWSAKMARGMSIYGASKVFGEIFIDILSCLLQKKLVVLCNDIDVAITLYNTLARLFVGSTVLGQDVVILEACTNEFEGAFVVDTRLPRIVKGKVDKSAHRTLGRYIREATAIRDNEASTLFVRQKISSLVTASEILSKNLKEKTKARNVLRLIEKESGITLKYSDLPAVLMLLRAQGKTDIANLVVMGELNGF